MKGYMCRCIDCCQLDKEVRTVVQGPSYSAVTIYQILARSTVTYQEEQGGGTGQTLGLYEMIST